MIPELTLAVVGIDFPNADGSNRRSEAMMTLPDEPVALIPEPRNKHDSNAIAVVNPRGVQIGYLSAECTPYVRARMGRGDGAVAIFQGIDGGAAFIRVRFGSAPPTLPTPADHPAASRDLTRSLRSPNCYDPDAFYPDEGGPEWGGADQSGRGLGGQAMDQALERAGYTNLMEADRLLFEQKWWIAACPLSGAPPR